MTHYIRKIVIHEHIFHPSKKNNKLLKRITYYLTCINALWDECAIKVWWFKSAQYCNLYDETINKLQSLCYGTYSENIIFDIEGSLKQWVFQKQNDKKWKRNMHLEFINIKVIPYWLILTILNRPQKGRAHILEYQVCRVPDGQICQLSGVLCAKTKVLYKNFFL